MTGGRGVTEGRGSNGREVSNERWHLATQPTPAHERRKVSRGLQNGNSTNNHSANGACPNGIIASDVTATL